IPQGKFTETEESPALDLSKQWMRLAEAAKLEHSSATQQLHQAWQDALKHYGPASLETARAHAKFLARYVGDLGAAIHIYDEIGHAVDGLSASDQSSSGDKEKENDLTGDVAELVRAEDIDRSYGDAACMVDPESCIPPDPDNDRILKEISGLVNILDEGGPTGE